MGKQIQIFTDEQFGTIRTIEQDGRVLFCGRVVVRALGYANTKDALESNPPMLRRWTTIPATSPPTLAGI